MAFELPPLPNFNVNVPAMPSPLDQYGKMLQLKSLLGQQSLLPYQQQEAQQRVQAETLENQKTQQDLESRQNLMKAIASGTFNKYAGVETADGSGFDAAGAYRDLIANHKVLPEQASEYTSSMLAIAKNQAEIRKTQGQAGEAEQNIRAKTLKSVADKLGDIGDMKADDAGKALADFKQSLVNNPKAYAGLSQDELGALYGANLEHLGAVEGHLGIHELIADFHKSKAEATTAAQNVIDEQGTSPEQRAIIKKDVETFHSEMGDKLRLTREEALARQQAMQGDPNAAAQLLASGALTLNDLKSRGSTPQFITQVAQGAQKINPTYNPADEVIAEQVAKSQTANQFFGSANSLIQKGGTLDQLEQLGKKIPQHNLPVLNTVDDWQKLARGKGPLAGYAAMVLGVADDYGKVMGGGTASDSARDNALHLFAQAASPEQRADAVAATRGAVQSQRDSRIGNNQFLRRAYGAEVGGQQQSAAAAFSTKAPNGKTYTFKDQQSLDAFKKAAGIQ